MKVHSTTNDGILIQLDWNETLAVHNALGESLENLEEWEFSTRMGVTMLEVERLLSAFHGIDWSSAESGQDTAP